MEIPSSIDWLHQSVHNELEFSLYWESVFGKSESLRGNPIFLR